MQSADFFDRHLALRATLNHVGHQKAAYDFDWHITHTLLLNLQPVPCVEVFCVCTSDQTGLISPCSVNFLVFVTQMDGFLRGTAGTLRYNSNLNVSCHGSGG